jgi:hypothetical protein|tara:strand:+ start:2872 stop:5616 length:2745 start_codon:yes stop_codon:yes gene_type:complete
MALVFNDRVKETSTTTGTGTLNLGGAFQDFQTFVAGIGNSNETYYNIVLPQTGEFEVGRGVVTDASPDTLSRLEVFTSSNSGNLVDFSAGTKTVFCTLPANKFVPGKFEGSNFTNSILIGHSNSGTLNNANGNVGVGTTALDALVTADNNVAVGFGSLSANASGNSNTALGQDSLAVNNSGAENTAVGSRSSYLLANGTGNTTIGFKAGEQMNNADADYNILIGHQAGDNITEGAGNVIIGSVDAAAADGDRTLKIAGYDGSTTTTWISGDSAGALTFADKIILGANKSIEFGDAGETILGDGTDLTIASSNKIILNADGAGQVFFKDGGTNLAKLFVSSQVFTLETIISDGDFAIKGNDGGSSVTALSLDMSEAGAATFNDNVLLGSGKQLKFHTAGDNIKFDGTNLLVTATNGLILDGDQQILLNDGGVNYAAFVSSSTRFTIHSQTSDKDFAINVNDGGSQLDALIFDASAAGAATFNSTVTANAGLKADNITIDGTEIDLSSGDLTIDVAGDITLDADGGDIIFADASTEIGRFTNDSSDFVIKSSVSDKDLVFRVNDGGSEVTAIRIDANNAGRVSMGTNIVAAENLSVVGQNNSSSATFKVKDTDGRGVIIQSPFSGQGLGSIGTHGTNSALGFLVDSNEVARFGTNGFLGIGTTSPQEEIHINGADPSIRIQDSDGGLTTITQAGNNLSFDVPGVIQLDAGGASIEFLDDSLSFLKIENSSNDAHLRSIVQDKDILLRGNDGGSQITALTLDMSEAGAATFNDKIILGANKVIEFGDSGETISGDGTDLTIVSSNDVKIDAANDIILDSLGDLEFHSDGTTIGRFTDSANNFKLTAMVNDKDFIFAGFDNGINVTALTLDMSEAGAATFNAGITATTGTFSGTVTANGEVLSAGVSAGFAVAMAIAL